jgi:hypothetical protein
MGESRLPVKGDGSFFEWGNSEENMPGCYLHKKRRAAASILTAGEKPLLPLLSGVPRTDE